MTDFTCADVVAKVREIAAANPDFVYCTEGRRSCVYVESKDQALCPSCLIGHALIALGVAPEDLARFDPDGESASIVVPNFASDRDETALAWLNVVQRYQDRGQTWAQAVALTDEAAARETGGGNA